jgi:hypothetical protein
MALTPLHEEIKERMWEMFTATEREAYANGFDLRHYRQDILKKSILDRFCVHPKTEDEHLEQIANNAWIYNFILQKVYDGTIDVPTIFQRYCRIHAEDMYDFWFNMFLRETYVC